MTIQLDFMNTADKCEVWDRAGKGQYLGCLFFEKGTDTVRPSDSLVESFVGLPRRGTLNTYMTWLRGQVRHTARQVPAGRRLRWT